ncbi:type VI secretion system lipoprotein TssJ [Paraburkholderia caffeinilytica]|uniref:type VI secretion system lipoprotein TssJ n=1 Tax=Paraburkholderia caffeinilytica TaxID=1761016 RepID=UPI0038BCB8F0
MIHRCATPAPRTIRTRWRALLALMPTIVLASCASTQKTADLSCDIYLYVSSSVNPDSRGQPSPILVGVYALKSTGGFEASGFTALQDHARTTLGDDLVSVEQMILLPGERKLVQKPCDPAVRQFGVVAGYRELDTSVWKTTFAPPAAEGFFSFWPFAPERTAIRVELGEAGLVIRTMNRTH